MVVLRRALRQGLPFTATSARRWVAATARAKATATTATATAVVTRRAGAWTTATTPQRASPAPIAYVRFASSDAVATQNDEAGLKEEDEEEDTSGWLNVRPPHTLSLAVEPERVVNFLEAVKDRTSIKASSCSAKDLSILAAKSAYEQDDTPFKDVLEQLKTRKLEYDPLDAILIIHALIKAEAFDRTLFSKLVDLIECRYYSMDLKFPEHPARQLFLHQQSFRSLVNQLPLDHKVRLVMLDEMDRPTGFSRRRQPKTDVDAKTAWETMDPVDMEAKEKEHFFKARVKVMNPKQLKVPVKRMQPGKRLRPLLAAQLMEAIPIATPEALAMIAQVTTTSKMRLLHGDLELDFQEAISKRLCSFDTSQVGPYAIAFTTAMVNYPGPAAFQAWKRKVLPAVARMTRATPDNFDKYLEKQKCVHANLRGLPHRKVDMLENEEDFVGIKIERSIALFCGLAAAKQVSMDLELFDGLTKHIKRYFAERGTASERLPLEFLTDFATATATAGIKDKAVLESITKVFHDQYEEDIQSGNMALSSYHIADVAPFAQALAYGTPRASDTLGLLWKVAEPKLRDSEPHLALMMIDAVVKGGSDELLTEGSVMALVDELLVQKLDFDSSLLGTLGA
mmetsp:Transcript_31703/g.67324  ORF Transcript_31703/g.67324 Transcript_31703/m.67324 type:complete len:624 (-) Transcript_31703:23-1894(-)|eukprot:CAMPEP_0206433826 /NCGR_PEP_ID=MMETSP0324_2-20121206/8756_1 /ASSEMBLY_ACC=CAM_ASM_000836 /TAXON_ID=2866 /ORGANISM="Crypthecodinium cohnii, Strain Seligo" /LENGTH=623 /DNA_ID=CAMNT_0053900149 /DNA_START=56 /DNA_END=1927 /DNA_ORIENTATION=+